MAKHNIERLLEGVRAVEARDSEAGLTIRRVIEKAEDNWNAHPDTDNTPNLVVKVLSTDDLKVAAEQIGLSENVNVKTFISVVEGLPGYQPPQETAEQREAREAAEVKAAETAEAAASLMSKAFVQG